VSRDARPLVGVIATAGIDADAWLRQSLLPETHAWRLVDPLDLPRQVVMVVWLWNPDPTPEQRRTNLRLVVRCHDRLLRQRGNRLVPSLFVASPVVTSEGETWRFEVQRLLRRFYTRRLKRMAPPALTDVHQITICDDSGRTGERIANQGRMLLMDITRWRGRMRRQAAGCLKAALTFTAAYVLVLLLSFPWNPSQREQPRPRPLLDWTWAQWRQHLDACRALLDRVGDRPWRALDRDTQASYTQYLRWLPVSFDLLGQRAANRQTERYQAEIQFLLSRMEEQVSQWIALDVRKSLPPPFREWLALSPALANFVHWNAKQRLSEELLDYVFDPRPGPSELRRLAEQFWIDDRGYLQSLLHLALTRTNSPEEKLTAVVRILREQFKEREVSRVHAPNRKLAYLQELEQAIDWAMALQRSRKAVTMEDFNALSAPSLIRGAAGHFANE